MFDLTPGALVRYGWSDRVLTLYTSLPDALTEQPDLHPVGDLRPARVVRVERSACFAVDADDHVAMLRCDPLPAVGDWIVATHEHVRAVLPRWAALTRVDADGESLQTLAANVDVVAVATPADRSSAARVEREITLAWDSGAVPLVLVTKVDVDPGGVVEDLRRRLVGVDLIAVSAVTGVGLRELAARFVPDLTGVLIGPSGAGKSTLVNALIGMDLLGTGAVREGDSRGRT